PNGRSGNKVVVFRHGRIGRAAHPRGILRFSSTSELSNYIESTSASTPKGRIRMVGRSHRQIKDATKQPSDSCDGNVTGNAAELTAERLNDILIAGATAITDIDI